MSGLGHLLLDSGHRVFGSDLVLNEAIDQLRQRGAQIYCGHRAEQIAAARPVLVIYSSAIRLDNPELRAAEALHIPVVRRAVLLAALVRRQRGICIAGMHGNTTHPALLAFAFDNLRPTPGYAVGPCVPELPRHARLSGKVQSPKSKVPSGEAPARPPFFVVEADESDGTLREFAPEAAIILNVDEEHLDYYANLDAVCREFEMFARQTRGPLIFCADDARLYEHFANYPRAFSYGFSPLAHYQVQSKANANKTSANGSPPGLVDHETRDCADSRETWPTTRFEVCYQGKSLGEFSTKLLGQKNVSNTCAVIALLHQLGFGPSEIGGAIASFRGVERRQQELFRDSRFCIVDDYGHHPAEIQATIQAMHQLRAGSGSRLLVAFQPHRFTRTQYLLNQFATCFSGVDRLWVAEVYAASEAEISGVNGQTLAKAVRAQGQAVEFVPTLTELRRAVRSAMVPGDLVLFLGAGDITKAAHELAQELSHESMAQNDRPADAETRRSGAQQPAVGLHVGAPAAPARLSKKLSRDAVLRADEPLAKRTTLRVGGQADFYVEPASEADLAQVLGFCAEEKLPFVILGRGSNLLIRDGGIRGFVICLAQAHFIRIEISGERLHCGAGVKLKLVSVEARRHGIAGLEFLEGIPGSVGGALRMNAGAMGSWMFEAVESIRFMDYLGAVHERKASEVYVEYRGCPLFKNHIALGAVLKGRAAAPDVIAQRMNQFSAKRWESQPAAASAGCIFKNPITIPAGKLIDELGLKGTRVGRAVVSDVHGNFIVNEGGATAQDVLNLIDLIKQRAKTARDIDLETEVEILGDELPRQN